MKWKPLQIEVRLVLCLVGSIALLFIMAVFLQDSLKRAERFGPALDTRRVLVEDIASANGLMRVIDTSARGYSSTGELNYLEIYFLAKDELRQQMDNEKAVQAFGGRESSRRELITHYLAVARAIVEPSPTTRPAPAGNTIERLEAIRRQAEVESTDLADQLQSEIQSLESEERLEGRHRIIIMWVFVGIIIAFAMLMTRWLARRIVRPIQQLGQAVHRLQDGDYSVRVELETGDELEQLGDALNDMAGSIQEGRAELEQTNSALSKQQASLKRLNEELEQRVLAKTEELQLILHTIEEEKATLEAIINRMPDGLMLMDGRGRFIRANEAALTILGHRDVAGVQRWIDKTPGAFSFRRTNKESLPLDEFPFYRAFRGESFSNFTLYVRRPDNQSRLVSFSGGPAVGQGLGGTTLSLCIFRDVTEELALRTELEETNARLAEASRLKDEFIATLSHELRTPLTPVITCAQLLRSEARLNEDDLDTLDMIERNARNLSRMIDEMLDLSAIMNSKLRLNREHMEMNAWVRRTLEPLRPRWEAKKLDCVFEASEGEALSLDIDPGRLTQVLTNLVTNAIKYTEEGGRIWVTLVADDHEVLISVKDTGIGLTRREIDEIFNIFHQTRNSLSQRAGGLGIGLSVARSLAELHGGGIHVESDGPGTGSTFTLWLPRQDSTRRTLKTAPLPTEQDTPEEVPVEKEPASASRPLRQASPVTNTVLLRGRRILLVEDSADTLDALRRILERRECQVLAAQSGTQGLDLALKERPEIIISDLGLPEMDGLELIRRIRAHADMVDLIAVSLSGAGRDQDRRDALAAGFDAHLVKPIDIEELDSVLVDALASREQYRPVEPV